MDSKKMVCCPNCGGAWLEGKIRHRRSDHSLRGRLKLFTDAFQDLSELGFIRAEAKSIRQKLQTFKVDKTWKCTSCGYVFPME